jgi:hypothetical protein
VKDIHIKFIPHSKQRYDTVGDYGETETEIWLKITEMLDPMHSCAILLHEIAEVFLVKQNGVPFSVIDEWDLAHPESDDPGSLPGCPYSKEHEVATLIERLFVALSGENWADYEKAIDYLCG